MKPLYAHQKRIIIGENNPAPSVITIVNNAIGCQRPNLSLVGRIEGLSFTKFNSLLENLSPKTINNATSP